MNKFIKIGIGIFIGIIILGLAYYLYPKTYLKISIAPDSASLSIDGGKARTIKSGSTIFIAPGKHTFKVSRDQFDSQTTSLTGSNNQTIELLVSLNPQTDAAQALLNTPNSISVHERVGAQQQKSGTDTLTQKYPILNDLPIVLHSLTISACQSQKYPNDPTKIALCVTTDDIDGAQMIAPAALQQKGYNPADYEIIYQQSTDS